MRERAKVRWRLLAVVAAGVWPSGPVAAHAITTGMGTGTSVDISDVAIMVSNAQDRTLVETGARLRLELRASGLDSHFADCATPDTWEDTSCGAPPPSLAADQPGPPERAEPSQGPRPDPARSQLAIFLGREDDVVTIEVIAKLADGWKPFRLIYVPPGQGGNNSSLLALRAVELLGDVRLDVQRWQAARQVPVAEKMTAEPAASLPWPPFHHWRLTAAASMLQGRRGLGASIAPALGIAADWGARFSLIATLAGPFYKNLSASTLGTANTRQEFALLGLRYALGGRWVRPFAGVATGVYHLRATTAATGDSDAGMAAAVLWAPFMSAGGGASISIARWFALTAQADVLLTAPAGDVTLGSTVVGRAGGPSFLMQTGACFFL